MPYILEELRKRKPGKTAEFKHHVDNMIRIIRTTYSEEEVEGVVNYTISRIVAGSMKPAEGWNYRWLNRAIGVFESAKLEFNRRLIQKYEDKKIKQNKDLPEYE